MKVKELVERLTHLGLAAQDCEVVVTSCSDYCTLENVEAVKLVDRNGYLSYPGYGSRDLEREKTYIYLG